jgi:hypothetical protein
VTFLPGMVGPRKPALRSCIRRAWRLAPAPERGLMGSESSCHISEPSLAICLDAIVGVCILSSLCNDAVRTTRCRCSGVSRHLFLEVEDSCTMVKEALSQKGMELLSAACKCTMVGPRQGIDSACSDVYARSPHGNGRLQPAGPKYVT